MTRTTPVDVVIKSLAVYAADRADRRVELDLDVVVLNQDDDALGALMEAYAQGRTLRLVPMP